MPGIILSYNTINTDIGYPEFSQTSK